jgi:hypothetical protein
MQKSPLSGVARATYNMGVDIYRPVRAGVNNVIYNVHTPIYHSIRNSLEKITEELNNE